jgi:hypothetical protein
MEAKQMEGVRRADPDLAVNYIAPESWDGARRNGSTDPELRSLQDPGPWHHQGPNVAGWEGRPGPASGSWAARGDTQEIPMSWAAECGACSSPVQT